jgi:hypothetical protein
MQRITQREKPPWQYKWQSNLNEALLIIIKEDDLINMTHTQISAMNPIWPAKPPSKQAAGHQVHGKRCQANRNQGSSIK